MASTPAGKDYSPKTANGEKLLTIVNKDSREMREIIQANNTAVIERTDCVNEFAILLVELDLLNNEDKNRIMRENVVETDRKDRLYDKIKVRGDWSKLIYAWEKHNKHIIEILLEYFQNTNIPTIQIDNKHEAAQNLSNSGDNEPRNENENLPLVDTPRNEGTQSAREEKNVYSLRRTFCRNKYFKVIVFCTCVVLVLVIIILGLVFGVIHWIMHVYVLMDTKGPFNEITTKSVQTFYNGSSLSTSKSITSAIVSDDKEMSNILDVSPNVTLYAPIVEDKSLDAATAKYTTTNDYKPSKSEPFIVTPIHLLHKIDIENPRDISKLTDSSNKLHLHINPKKLVDWESINTVNNSNVRALDFGGHLNAYNVNSIIEKFRSFLTHIVFSLGNILCDEFDDYKVVANSSKVDTPFLQELYFVGDVNCRNVFQFVINKVPLKNIRVLKFEGTVIYYNEMVFIEEILQLSQSTLEYIYFSGVSICVDCKIFGVLDLPKLKYAELVFNLGVSNPENAEAINTFNSNIPLSCRSTYPNEKTFRVEC